MHLSEKVSNVVLKTLYSLIYRHDSALQNLTADSLPPPHSRSANYTLCSAPLFLLGFILREAAEKKFSPMTDSD